MKSEKRVQVLSVAQEITFVKALSSNDRFLRDRALRRLKKWFSNKSQDSYKFTEEGFMRIWKGLFYCVWMSDKPLIQENCVNDVSNLIHCFNNFNDACMFIRCFFQAISQAWYGLDQYRLDKFMMLVRRFLRQCFELLKKGDWKKKQVKDFGNELYKALTLAPIGLNMHFIEIYLEELAKVGEGKLNTETVQWCIEPFGNFMSELTDTRLVSSVIKFIFLYLMRQSETGIKYQLKFDAWKQLGFPGGTIDVMEEVEDEKMEGSDVEEDDMIEEGRSAELDARAGNVDVILPPIKFDPVLIIKFLNQLKTKKETTTKARKSINSLIEKFKTFSEGQYPLGLKEVEIPEREDEDEIISEAAERLIEELESDKSPSGKKAKKGIWEISSVDNMTESKRKSVENEISGKWQVTNITESLSPKRRAENSESSPQRKKKHKALNLNNKNESENNVKSANQISVNSIQVEKEKQSENAFTNGSSTIRCKSPPKNQISTDSVLAKKPEHSITPETKEKSPKEKKSKTAENIQNKKEKGKNPENALTNGANPVECVTPSKTEKLLVKTPESKEKSPKRKKSRSAGNVHDKKEKRKGPENALTNGANPVECISPSKTEISKDSVLAKTPESKDKSPKKKKSKVVGNNYWGSSEWDTPLGEGEVEIFIPNKKYAKKRKELGLSCPQSMIKEGPSSGNSTPINATKLLNASNTSTTPGSAKKVEFVLNRNMAQDETEYKQTLKKHPYIHFDGNKKPGQGLLKPSPVVSPVNPFYRHLIKPTIPSKGHILYS